MKTNKFKNTDKTEPANSKKKDVFKSINKESEVKQAKNQFFGLAILLFSLFLAISIISYFFTWKADQSQIQHSILDYYFDKTIVVENWLGKIGAVLAHFFVHKLFGVTALVIPFLLLLVGFKITLGTYILPLKKSAKISLFLIFWLAPTLSYLVSDQFLVFGGGLGYHFSSYLISLAGEIGFVLLSFFTLLAFVLATFNLQLSILWSKFSAWLEAKKETRLTAEPDDAPNSNFGNSAPNVSLYPTGDPNAVEETDSQNSDYKTLNEVLDEEWEDTHPTQEKETKKEFKEPEFEVVMPEEEPQAEELQEQDGFEVIKPENKAAEKLTDSPAEDMQLEISEGAKEEELSEEELEAKLQEFGDYDPKLDLSQYKLPPLDLLDDHGGEKERSKVSSDELEANKKKIVETLNNYGIGVARIKATIGPTITLYEMVPEAGVRISKIKNLEDDIALSIAALGIRIIAPIPGKGTIGIEVPNSKPEIVPMRNLIASDKFQNSDMELPIALGKTIGNETYIADLAKMPHLLMAGATGQGKSVGLNAILTSLLYKKHPAQVKFVLVDPKKVELTLFNKIERHFLAKLPDSDEAIITDTHKVINTLNSLCIEMDTRYELLKEANVRNIKEYNAKFIKRRLNPENGHKYLPYIVVVIDEFADLIMTAGKEVETPIARLAQLARAIGIHLIIATQRPSVNIITGTIKANFPARIAFRVSAKIDSRTILDTQGADQLIGRGDMLISNGNDLVRVQCGFVDTPEVEKICDFIGEQRGYPSAFILPEFIDENASDGGGIMDDDERDSLFEDAARVVVIHQQGSASLLQRKLKLGFNRAGRIIDQLETAGIIGPFKGSKAREVLFPDEQSLEQYLNNRINNS
ncbi:MAG: DNA translocase FtsK 4TM domain-containing protein [Luteibaculaceae bacterium]